MKLVIQRVKKASVKVDDRIVSEIGNGLMVLVGVTAGDNRLDAVYLAKKTAAMRIFNDNEGVMNLSVKDVGGEILSVSQFTLYAMTHKGNRPSYINAARPDVALPLYDYFCEYLSDLLGRPVGKGVFGSHMDVELINDGPVTIIIDSKSGSKDK